MSKRNRFTIPSCIPLPVSSPGSICQNMRFTFDTIVFHYVNFTTRRPFHTTAQSPNSRPCPSAHGNLGTNLESAIQELFLAGRSDAWGSVLNKLPLLPPVITSDLIPGIFTSFFFPCFNNQLSIFAVSVAFLIPLGFLIACKAIIITPNSGIRKTVCIKFITPYQFPLRLSGQIYLVRPLNKRNTLFIKLYRQPNMPGIHQTLRFPDISHKYKAVLRQLQYERTLSAKGFLTVLSAAWIRMLLPRSPNGRRWKHTGFIRIPTGTSGSYHPIHIIFLE